jgi:phosphate-selective porin OprO/OprP
VSSDITAMRNLIRHGAALIAAAALTIPSTGAPVDSSELQALREQVHALEQQLKVLARQIELKEEAATAAAPTTPKITVNDKGVTLASADAANSLRLRGLVQLDHRAFFNDGGAAAGLNNNGFVLRRARLITEGMFAKNYTFQLVTEFGGSAVSILDANVGINVSPALQFKLGKFKAPVGLELLQSDSWTFFNERSIATNLVPNRDLGITAGGDILGGKVSYTVGVLNGVADGASSANADFDNEKDFVARLVATPFKEAAGSALQGLSFGVGASYGREKGTAGRTGAYRTDGQQTFFSYLGTTITDGPNWRVSPQFDYRYGSFGLQGEYTVSTSNVRPSATGPKAELRNKGWQLAAGYVLTGENSSYNGVVPATNFDFSKGTWGAFEVTARYANLQVDEDAFPLYAALASNASEASSIGLGLNWYLSKAVAFKLDYYQTDFDFPAGAPAVSTNAALRQDEKTLITRFQIAF